MSHPARRLLLLSNSTLHPTGYLEYAQSHITDFFTTADVKKILFVPYALSDHDDYTATASEKLREWGFEVVGIHTFNDPKKAVREAQAIFIGGGNTFRLLKKLYDNDLVTLIRKRCLEEGVPYMGSSAGTNVSTCSIHTTNDMPIVYPPSFEALRLVPFNINPHFQDADPDSTHKGETRMQRIQQYQEESGVPPVLAVREGSLLHIEGDKATLKGTYDALLFKGTGEPKSYKTGTDFSFLFDECAKG